MKDIGRRLNLLLPAGALLIGFALFISSCEKDEDLPTTGAVVFNMDYVVDGAVLEFDKIMYQNKAGNQYSVTHLEYFMSNVVLVADNGTEHAFGGVFYLNPRKAYANKFQLEGVDFGKYTSFKFNIGLDSTINKTNALPSTTDNQNMFWPVPMGGGYHFLKFEGHFLDSTGTDQGYAMHLGTNSCLVSGAINESYEFTADKPQVSLEMNLNSWFESPNMYDLNSAGYIMGNQAKMREIAANGKDVLSVKNGI